MSHKSNFQCFNAVDGEGSHKSHTSRFPRIPQRGMVAHGEPLEESYLCSVYRHAQALEAFETPLYHSRPCHNQHPHQYVLRRPTRPEEPPVAHSGHEHHIHHHRYNKSVVLVKNSDPSFQRTIILRRRTLRSFGLFLEEISELMQYHIRKLYTLEGRKVSSLTPVTLPVYVNEIFDTFGFEVVSRLSFHDILIQHSESLRALVFQNCNS